MDIVKVFLEKSRLLERVGAGNKWRIVVIEAGMSKNNRVYPAEVLREAVPLLHDVAINQWGIGGNYDHLHSAPEIIRSGAMKENQVGRLINPVFDEDLQAIVAEAIIYDSKASAMLADHAENPPDDPAKRFGFSVHVTGSLERGKGGQPDTVAKILECLELTFVTDPAAGGRVLELIQEKVNTMDKLKKLVDALAKKYEGFKFELTEKTTEAEIYEAYAEFRVNAAIAESAGGPDNGGGAMTRDEVKAMIAEMKTGIVETFTKLRENEQAEMAEKAKAANKAAMVEKMKKAVEAAKLEEKDAADIVELFERKETFTESDYMARIKRAQRMGESWETFHDAGDQTRTTGLRRDETDKLSDAILASFYRQNAQPLPESLRESGHFTSLRSAITEKYGFRGSEREMTDLVMTSIGHATPNSSDRSHWDAHLSELAESRMVDSAIGRGRAKQFFGESTTTTSTFTYALSSAMNRFLLAEPPESELMHWRKVCSIRNASDFRNIEIVNLGGYGEMSVVAEDTPYPVEAVRTDERVQMAVDTYGSIIYITDRTIANDDIGVLAQLLNGLRQGGMRTLNTAVFTTNINANPTLESDSTTLFHANHGGNLGSTALSSTSLYAGITAMAKQTQKQGAAKLGIRPKYLVHPVDLQETVDGLLFANADSKHDVDNTVFKRFQMESIGTPYISDVNNWFLFASPSSEPVLTALFYLGRQAPELIASDDARYGSYFTADSLGFKRRFRFEVKPVNFRGAYGAIV